MEVGIEPAPLYTHHVKLYSTVVKLSSMCNTLSQISCHTLVKTELKIIETLLSTIKTHLQIIVQTLHSTISSENNSSTGTVNHSHSSTEISQQILGIHLQLWNQLSKPLHSNKVRAQIFDCLILINKTNNILTNAQQTCQLQHTSTNHSILLIPLFASKWSPTQKHFLIHTKSL